MDSDDQLEGDQHRTFVMRNVKHVHGLLAQIQRQAAVVPPNRALLGLVELREVRGQRSEFMEIAPGSDQEILVFSIQLIEVADEIPNVSSGAEFVDLADVDCNAHGLSRSMNFSFLRP